MKNSLKVVSLILLIL